MYNAFAEWGTLNTRRAALPLVSLMEGEDRWKALTIPQDILPQNWGESKRNRSVICMVLKLRITTDIT
ncbi:hypothetical protein TNCV_3092451 [Trichonephila clavipes]|uniref:Uncharacterized protein n=1 Tax=Trichonephila clavipes TaxID=2585209 RepID=A0A8X6V8U7_TRICX|nr:hypothetical protein TNCV_3092451 [Trichonephila clavipes]